MQDRGPWNLPTEIIDDEMPARGSWSDDSGDQNVVAPATWDREFRSVYPVRITNWKSGLYASDTPAPDKEKECRRDQKQDEKWRYNR